MFSKIKLGYCRKKKTPGFTYNQTTELIHSFKER